MGVGSLVLNLRLEYVQVPRKATGRRLMRDAT
jgi:hypothetical protein